MSPPTPADPRRPEMAQRASNPFGAARPPEEQDPPHKSLHDIFGQSLEVDDSDSSDDNGWDRDDSSDDDDDDDDAAAAPKPASVAATAAAAAARPASPQSSNISFNTAFAQPADNTNANNTNNKPDGETNPFLGLLSAAAAAAAAANTTTTAAAAAAAAAPAAEEQQHDAGDPPKPEPATVRVRALYPYTPDDAAELRLEAGSLVETRPPPEGASAGVHGEPEWMYGELLAEADEGDGWRASGSRGWFPADYAETLGPAGSRAWLKSNARFGAAKYDYAPQHEDELAVAAGDRVRVLDGDPADGWWKVRKIQDRTSGMLPAIYVELDKE
ncbi:hypothetical protein H4R18_005514 [Coemansia javaensis]|uniref:SH3 domain-containing protein n=1 Tax=Coemansia javaensis TaxID=2761396 RepID=A0A9W8H2Y7_9FUNG|nr:hypothetical protein H4R18_005514 [Coemansia javaensis]